MAVVKADAYGHGLLPSARAALRGGATWLGVAQLPEAIELRQAGIDAPAAQLAARPRPGPHRGGAARDRPLGLDPVVPRTPSPRRHGARASEPASTSRWTPGSAATAPGATELDALVARSPLCRPRACSSLVGVFSHFAYADAPQHPTVRAQQERFEGILAQVERAGLRPEVRHLANSAATLTNPSAHYDLVRPGLAVYGLSPVPDLGSPLDFGLREAMRLTARLASVKRLPGGAGHLLRPHVHDRAPHPAGPGPDGVRRRHTAQCEQRGPRAGGRPAPAHRRPGLHGPVRPRPRRGLPRCRGRRGRALRPGRGGGADRPGLGESPRARSTTRSSRGWAPGCPARTRGREPHEPPSGQHRPRPGPRPGRCRRRNRSRHCRRPADQEPQEGPVDPDTARQLRPDPRQGARGRGHRRGAAPRGGRRAGPGRSPSGPPHGRLQPRLHAQPEVVGTPAARPGAGRLPRRAVGPAQPRPVGARVPRVQHHRPARAGPAQRHRRDRTRGPAGARGALDGRDDRHGPRRAVPRAHPRARHRGGLRRHQRRRPRHGLPRVRAADRQAHRPGRAAAAQPAGHPPGLAQRRAPRSAATSRTSSSSATASPHRCRRRRCATRAT